MMREVKVTNAQSDEEASSAMVLGVVLHGLAIITAVAGVVIASDRDAYVQPSFLIGKDPPGRFIALGIIYVLCVVAFTVFTVLETHYRVESSTITGIGLAFGGIGAVLGGGFAVVASFACSSAVFWLWVIAFFAVVIVYAMQCAAVVVALVRVSPVTAVR